MNLVSTIERTPSPTLRAASVRVSREINAAPGRIFDAWLDARAAPAFLFAAQTGVASIADIDARVGGEFRIVHGRDGGDVEYRGRCLEIDRPHRLVFSLFVEKFAQHDDRVVVELAPVVARSLLVLTHELSLPNPAERSRIRYGWTRALERLDARLVSAWH